MTGCMSGYNMAWFERGSEEVEYKDPKIPDQDEDVDDLGSDFVEDAHDCLIGAGLG